MKLLVVEGIMRVVQNRDYRTEPSMAERKEFGAQRPTTYLPLQKISGPINSSNVSQETNFNVRYDLRVYRLNSSTSLAKANAELF